MKINYLLFFIFYLKFNIIINNIRKKIVKNLSLYKSGYLYKLTSGIRLLETYDKTKKNGNIVFLLDNCVAKSNPSSLPFNTEFIRNIINSKCFNIPFDYRYFWRENIINFSPVINKKFSFNKSLYKKFYKEKVPEINTGFSNLSAYNGKNFIYDLTIDFFYLYNKLNMSTSKKVLQVSNIFKEIMNRNTPKEYDTRYLLISLDFILPSFLKNYQRLFPKNKVFSMQKISNEDGFYKEAVPLTYINFNYYFENLKNIFGKTKTYLVFLSFKSNLFFYIDVEDPVEYNKYKNLITLILRKIHGYSAVLSDEERNLFSHEPENEEIFKQKAIENNARNNHKIFNNIVNTVIRRMTVKNYADLFDKSSGFDAIKSENDFNSLSNITNAINNTNIQPELNNIQKAIETEVEKHEDKEISEEKAEEIINNNEEIKKELITISEKLNNNSLSEVQKKIIEKNKIIQDKAPLIFKGKTIKEITIKDIVERHEDKKIEEKPIQTQKVLDKKILTRKVKNYEKSYNNKQLQKDFLNIFLAFSKDKENPLFVKNIDVEDTSTDLTFKKTYTVTYVDKNNKTLKIKVDIPDIMDGYFIFINNSKKIILKQFTALPLTKTDPDEVFLTTNYNKFQIFRTGQKFSQAVEKFKKIIFNPTFNKIIKTKLSEAVPSQKDYLYSLEYNQFIYDFEEIEIKDNIFLFRNEKIENAIEDLDVDIAEIPSNYQFFGYNKKNKALFFLKDNKVYSNVELEKILKEGKEINENSLVLIAENLISFFLKLIDKQLSKKEDKELFENLLNEKVGEKYIYSSIVINNRKLPLIILLGFYRGLQKILDLYKIEYQVSNKRNIFNSAIEAINYKKIPFKDLTLYYKATPEASLLLSGLVEMNTKEYNFSEFDDIQVYLEYFEENLNATKNISKAFKLTLERMIDPITEEILLDHNQPTEISEVLLLANTMLANHQYKEKNDPTNYRLRCTELIASYLYKILADQFNKYNSSTNEPFSIPQDKLIKVLLESRAVDNFSTLNPLYENEQSSAVTMKGNAGLNSEYAYTYKLRAYNEKMQGLIGNYVNIDGSAGIKKYLTYNPKIKSVRGYIDEDAIPDHSTHYFMANELISPFTALHSDPPRQSMTIKQSSHIVPTNHQDAPLIGSGIEKTFAYSLSKDFVVVAKDDGIVQEIDKKNNIMIIKYDNGEQDAINIGDQISKNSASGFYISNKLDITVKEKERFKKDQILAKNSTFFKGDKNGVTFSTGTLAKVAILPLGETLEDSSIITKEFSKKLKSTIIMKEAVSLSPYTNVIKMVNIGDEVKTSEPLIIFESSAKEKEGIDLLSKLDDKYKDNISQLSSNIKKAKYSGIVKDIRIYYNRDLDEFSPSLQKIIKNYIKEVKEKRDKIKSLNTSEPPNIILPSVEKVNSNRIMNTDVDGVLIEFYISHENETGVGGKLTMQAACKTIVSKVIPEGQEPFSEFRPDENIDVLFSPLSIISRMTLDLISLTAVGKVIIELKRKVKDIWEN